jgi:uncharacterized cofD-like protein
MKAKKQPHIVVIGGGTGTFTVLSGLKKYPVNLTAIVTMSDDGGSTGVLRDELGVLPPGDVRQCLVALSSSDQLMRSLMNYRFAEGGLKGHSFGNLLLSALEKLTGSFDAAVEKTSEVLRIRGRVIPSTLDEVRLAAQVGSRIVRGEQKIHKTTLNGNLKKLWLEPRARINPKAVRAIAEADLVLIGPGDLYSSLIPNLLVKGMPEAIRKSRAKKVFVCNLMANARHSKNYSVADYAAVIERYLGKPVDMVIYNDKTPSAALVKRYAREGEMPTRLEFPAKSTLVGGNLVAATGVPKRLTHDAIVRSLIRHDPKKLAEKVYALLGKGLTHTTRAPRARTSGRQ